MNGVTLDLPGVTWPGKLRRMSSSPENSTGPARPSKKLSAQKKAQLASIQSKGGKTVTAKKRTHLASIAAKGGQTVTDKKREHLRKALAARWAKERAKKAV